MKLREQRGIRRWIPILAAASAFAALAAFPAMAAQTVKNIRLNFEDRYETGVILEPTVTCRTSGVSIESIDWSKDVENWKPGTSVTATITLTSDDEFSSSYGSRYLRVDGASLSSANAVDGNLKVKVSYKPVVQLAAPEEAGWSALDRTRASWKSVKYATGYEIRLYRDDYLVRTIDATGTSKDLKDYINKEGYYYYEIRAVGKDSNDKKYRKSSEYITSSDRTVEDLGETGGYWRNYTDGKKYQREDGTYPVSQWEKILGDWYYFDDRGYAATGWKQLGSAWYYMDGNGVMLTGWQKINGVWYYLNPDGDMAVGWRETEPGKWYYLNADGSMASNTTVEGKHLDETGLCID